MKGKRLWIALAIIGMMGVGTLVTGALAYFSDTENSTGSSPTVWTSTQWTQTSKTDFDAGVLTGVNTSFSSGNVILQPGYSTTTADLFLFWDGAGAVPTGWTDVSVSGQAFYQRFPRGAATWATGGAATHSHTIGLVSVGPPSATTDHLSGGTNRSSSTHTNHGISGSTATASSLPSYRNLRVIRATNVPAIIPAGAIAIFDTTPPTGWTRYSAQDNYFIRGEAVGVVGTTGGSNTHNHTFSRTITASTEYQAVSTATPRIATAATGHTHTISGTTPDADTRPPYLTVILAKADNDTAIPYGMIGMFNATPTGAWSVLSDTGGPFDSVFLVGGSSYGATGGASTHNHADAIVTSSDSSSTTNACTTTPNVSVAANGHNHSVTLSFGTPANTLPPYRNTIFAKAIYPTSGTVASPVLDTTVTGSRWDALFWDETLQANTDITFAVRARDTSFLMTAATPTWTAVVGNSPFLSGLPAGTYKQWRATLTTTDTANTPTLSEVRLYYYGP